MTCERCYVYYLAKSKKTPCRTCKKPVLDGNNEIAWEIFNQMTSQARVGGLGGIFGFDLNSLPVVLRLYQIPEESWLEYFIKLTRTWAVATKHWNKKEEPKKS